MIVEKRASEVRMRAFPTLDRAATFANAGRGAPMMSAAGLMFKMSREMLKQRYVKVTRFTLRNNGVN